MFGSDRTEKLVVVSTFVAVSVVAGVSKAESVPSGGVGATAAPSLTTSNSSALRAAPSASLRQEVSVSAARQQKRIVRIVLTERAAFAVPAGSAEPCEHLVTLHLFAASGRNIGR